MTDIIGSFADGRGRVVPIDISSRQEDAAPVVLKRCEAGGDALEFLDYRVQSLDRPVRHPRGAKRLAGLTSRPSSDVAQTPAHVVRTVRAGAMSGRHSI